LLTQLNTENRKLKEEVNQQHTQITMAQNEKQEVEVQVAPVASKCIYVHKVSETFAQKLDQNPIHWLVESDIEFFRG
jgi:hypothetical protein